MLLGSFVRYLKNQILSRGKRSIFVTVVKATSQIIRHTFLCFQSILSIVLHENRSYFPEERKYIVFALQHGGNDVT